MRAPAALLLALAATGAAAQPAGEDQGFVLAARAGYGVPFGEVAHDGEALADLVPAKIPLWLQLGYRFARRVQGAAYVELAPARVDDAACGAGGSCEAFDLRFGLLVELRLAPGRTLDPWIGVGVGVEILQAEVQGPDPGAPPGEYESKWAGIEIPLELGLDVRISDRVALGPYATVSLAKFTSVEAHAVGGSGPTGSIEGRELHGWVQGGLRATFRL